MHQSKALTLIYYYYDYSCSGKPLAGKGALSTDSPPSWECPSPDVQIKTAALRTLAQAFVPDDPEAQPSSTALKILEVFIPKLVDLTDVDTDASSFEGFRWHLATVQWVHDKKKVVVEDTPEMENVLTYNWNEYDEEERKQLEKQARDASPDAGWVRYAAGTALCRLMRAYDGQMTGNDYMALALICQDPLAEVRKAFLERISRAVAYFQPSSTLQTRPNPQRAAKMAALWAIYAADPVEEHCRLAFMKLKKFVYERRNIVDKISLAAASAGKSGSLMNEMPELILPFFIYLMAHHPDYESTELFDDEAQSVPGENEPTVLQFLRNALQLGLEALIVPASELGKEEAAIEVANTAALSLKLLRSIKYCDALSLAATPRGGEVDPVATGRAHQVCDIAVFIAREILRRVMGATPRPLNKFPGRVAIPKLCFKMQATDENTHKRKDGSDIPGRFRPALGKLFTEIFAPDAGVVGVAAPVARQVKNKGRALDARKAPRSSHPAKRHPKHSIQEALAGTRVANKKRGREEPPVNPVRQQPRREAKDAAAAIFVSSDDDNDDDERNGTQSTEMVKDSPVGTLSADVEQNSHEGQDVSLGQENNNKLNMGSIFPKPSERHGKSMDVISGAKVKRARG